jgi:hypothetical protein
MKKCLFCGKSFKTIRDILIHCSRTNLNNHPNCKEYKNLFLKEKDYIKCEICGSAFLTFLGLSFHLSRIENMTRNEYFQKFPKQEELYNKYLKEYILENIIIDNDCWLWLKTKENRDGYRMINGKLAHRASFGLFKGKIKENSLICHICDNPSCINPDHLYEGTNQTNMDDMKNRGRSLSGNKNPSKKLEVRKKISLNNSMNKLENRLKLSNVTKGIPRPKHEYLLIDLDGKEIIVRNLFGFCKENNLNYRYLLELSKNKRKYISGWNCIII